MPTLTPTAANAATTKASDVVSVVPPLTMTDEKLKQSIALDGLNVPFIADLVSSFLAHERCGRHLYRSVAGRTNNPVLKKRYEQFGAETERHVEIYEDLVTAMGGSPYYVSPAARAVEATDSKLLESTFLLGGSIDIMTEEMVMLDAVLLAESVCHANWQAMGQLGHELPEGDIRTKWLAAVEEVEQQEDEHLEWAREARMKMALVQARSPAMAAAGAKAEELVATVKSWFS